jgi:arylformamidase
MTTQPDQEGDWLDTQYDNRARVPQCTSHLARWAAESARARAARPCRIDVAYGAAPAERLDLFVPRRAAAPVLVFIHGGYWRALDKSDVSFVGPAFVDAGALVVVPNYSLCPAVTIETIAVQVARSVAWTWRHAAAYGGDVRRIVVAGHSAGGHLAAMMLACRWPDLEAGLPAGLVHSALSLSGLFDLEPISRTPFLRADLRLTADAVRRLSPALYPPPRGPLVALAGGDESEEFLRHNRLIRERWGARAVPVVEALPGLDHFTVLDALAAPAGRAHVLALELLGLRPPASLSRAEEESL